MKKFVAIIMSVLMVLLLFAGCGAKDNSGEAGTSGDVSESGTEPEEAAFDDSELLEFNNEGKISETVLYDESGLKVTATELEYFDGYAKLNLLLENNTEKDYTFYSGTMGYSCNSVNGYMITGMYLNSGVTAGSKKNDSVEIDYDELMICGINEIADIEIAFDIEDDKNKDIYTGPLSLKTSIADGYEYKDDGYSETIKKPELEELLDCTLSYFSDEKIYSKKRHYIEN